MPSVDVGTFISNLNPLRRQTTSYRMPVLSPRHSSSLTGSYRSTTFSTSLSRPYYGTSSYSSSPRISTTSYTERYTNKSYTTTDDVNNKKIYARHTSITDDGGLTTATTRYRDETTREKSLRRDSLNRGDSGFRDCSRDLSLTRSETSSRERNNYSSTLSMIDSVADLRNKYSPSNYVPAVLRKQDNIARSKSINDIGRPPIEKITETTTATNKDSDIKQEEATATTATSSTTTSSSTSSSSSSNNKESPEKLTDIPEKANEQDLPKHHNHTTNFASYIPTKEFYIEDETTLQNDDLTTPNNDITTSPRLPRSSISRSSSISNNTLNSSTPNNRGLNPMNNRPSAANNRSTINNRVSGTPTSLARSHLTDDDFIGRNNYERPTNASRTQTQGLNGLKNIGNTCFMNSVIQCLSNTRYLLEYVREDAYLHDINTSISSMKGALIKAFSQVIQELWSPDSSDKVVNTAALKSQIQRFAPRFMGFAQQDAQEFLRYLLEGLHEDVNRVMSKPKPITTDIDDSLSDAQKGAEAWSRYLRMDNSYVLDIFVGQLRSTLRCTHCGHCSLTFDPFWDLSVSIPQRQGTLRLSQCLEHFTREETMDGDEKPTCSKCKERRKCTKSFCIQKFPKILVIHLKRFSPNERFRGKLNLVIDFPLQGLDMSSFAASKSQTECMYNLYAISNHSGTTYSGHYTAYCKHPYSGQWHEYNDSRVSTISPKNVISSEAYLLFYELAGQNSHL